MRARVHGVVGIAVFLMVAAAPRVYAQCVGCPSVASLHPSSGSTAGGTVVTMTGINLAGVTQVMFGANAATSVSCSSTSCTLETPAGTGAVDVRATNANGTSADASADDFSYTATPAAACATFLGADVLTAPFGRESASVGDFNGDGIGDLAIGINDTAGQVSILLNLGNGSFGPPTNYAAGTARSLSRSAIWTAMAIATSLLRTTSGAMSRSCSATDWDRSVRPRTIRREAVRNPSQSVTSMAMAGAISQSPIARPAWRSSLAPAEVRSLRH
ncbi:MAG TPA: IPT/TIG domain-containing protein [Thermoanaerobaculia bacterium]|jgi:hypothetical protein|nr:IPT/TIG domain-containing protein [Thermoanaerobaculia bacterium]